MTYLELTGLDEAYAEALSDTDPLVEKVADAMADASAPVLIAAAPVKANPEVRRAAKEVFKSTRSILLLQGFADATERVPPEGPALSGPCIVGTKACNFSRTIKS